MRLTLTASLLLCVGVLAAGCQAGAPEPPAPTIAPSSSAPDAVASEPLPTPDDVSPTAGIGLGDEELAALGVNELGRVLVLEWHEIQDENGRWSNSLATFRAQLAELQERGYRPISLDEFIDGTMDLPAGLSPVLLTFDDSYKEHLFFGPDGETPDPDSVVGILQAMHAEDPTWRPLATFAFYWPYPFRETDPDLIGRKLRYLADNGFDLSNHTMGHDNLRDLSDDEVVANLAGAEERLAEVVGRDLHLRSITLTQGIWPENRDLAMAGATETFAYDHDIALEVGFQPTRSPFHLDYDPRNVQRVQAWLPEFRRWLDWLDEKPGRRFVSDGDATSLAFQVDFLDVVGDPRGLAVRTYAEPTAVSSRNPTSCVSLDGSAEPCRQPGEPVEDA